jgi:dihydroxyacid dehydratase/phosphogluconate dehydratase
MASAIGVNLTIDDFTRIGADVPVIADLKPSGKYMMSELVEIGGPLPLMKMLLDAGLLHGDCMTETISLGLMSFSKRVSTASPARTQSLFLSAEMASCALEFGKLMPGCIMGLARLNRPSVFVYGGTIQPGKGHTDVVSVFEAVGQFASNTISEIELENS